MENKTYKVLIADDEYWTREKLCAMIDWPRYSLCCMKPAADGEEVLQRLETEHPDILITDINMPFVNGVELLNILHDKYPDIITFVVSGYSDFEYVKSSFIAGSINYLVKPITKIDLVNALSKALEIISARQAQQIELLKAASLLQDREYSQLLEKEDAAFSPNITVHNNQDFAGMSLMLLKIHDLSPLANAYGHDMNLLSYSVKAEIRNCMQNDSLLVFNYIYRPNEFAILSNMDNKTLETKARALMAALKPLFQAPLTVVLSGHSYALENIHEAYTQNLALLLTRVYAPVDALLVAGHDAMPTDEKSHNKHLGDDQARDLRELLRQKKKHAIENLVFHATGLADCTNEQWRYREVKQMVKRIFNTFMETLSGEISSPEVADFENLIGMAERTIEFLDVERLCDALQDIIEYSLSIGHPAQTNSVSSVIQSACRYIDEHYNEDVSLSTLAKRFGLSSAYFSRVFGQETGESLMLYITRKKMEKAAAYIGSSDLSLTEIAFMVGYDDYAYFNRVFRKTYGISPRDYRKENTGVSERKDGI